MQMIHVLYQPNQGFYGIALNKWNISLEVMRENGKG